MGKPAARVGDFVQHPLPPTLSPGPGSFNVLIGNLPAWRGVPVAVASSLKSAKKTSDTAIQVAEKATAAAPEPASKAAAKAAEEATKAASAVAMGTLISSTAAGADIHVCSQPLPIPPHGPGVVVNGSKTVLINGLPACFVGNTIVEAVGPPNKITNGLTTVLIGG
ncbi:MAG: PAAR domain-containing protein [Synechococcus sp.]